MKKVISLILVLALCLGLCACNRSSTTETTEHTHAHEETEATETTAPTETEAPTEETESEETEPEETVTTIVGTPGIVYNADNLNVRKGAGTTYDIVKSLKRGDTVTIYEQVEVSGVAWGRMDDGWVSMQYISLDAAAINHVHSYTTTVVAPTCTEAGYTRYTCACGDVYDDHYVATTGHTWTDWVTTKAATETSTGTAKRSCKVCGETETKTLGKLLPNHTHSYTSTITRAATCSQTGIKTYKCSCGDSYTETIEKLAHSYKDTVTAATCTARGYTTHTCSVCGYSYKDSYTSMVAHSYTTTTVEATCTTAGYTKHTCTVCGSYYTDNQVAALGHSYAGWITTVEPTTTSTGTATRTCTVCGETETKTLAKLNDTTPSTHVHTYTTPAVEVAPTCTEDGYYIRYCSTCSEPEITSSYKPATGHSYVQTGHKDATCTEDGYTTYKCSVCGATYMETIAASHTWAHYHEDAVTEQGEVYYMCTTCSATFATYSEWEAHADYYLQQQINAHQGYTTKRDTIVVTPAVDYDYCTVCGTKKD